MRALRSGVHTLRNRLLLAMCSLVFFTAVSASLAAYGVATVRLDQQREIQLDTAESAVFSLLLAEQSRITNQLLLFSERPTLQTLLQSQQKAELELYIQDFRSQSGLDFLAVYLVDGTLLASNGRINNYSLAAGHGFLPVDDLPLLAAQQVIRMSGSDVPLGTAVAGIWLERPSLDNLATATGTQLHWSASATSTALPLTNSSGQTTLFVEVTLTDEKTQLRQALLWPLGISTAVLVLAGWLVSWLLVRRQTNSLQKLTNAAQKIGQGNVNAPLPLVTAPTEMRYLATALHRLQAQLIIAQNQRIPQQETAPPPELEASKGRLPAARFLFDDSRLEIQHEGREPMRLTPLEARLLEMFMRNPGQVLSSEVLITAVWGNDGGDRTMLKQLIYRLRSKIDPENDGFSHIETFPGTGYSFKT